MEKILAAPTERLASIWRAPVEALLEPTSFGVSGGLWSLPIKQRLEVPPLDYMRVIVNLSPLTNHEFWSDGRKRRSSASPVGALRIGPMHETAWAQVCGDAFSFAQIYLPSIALFALDRPALAAGSATAFRDPGFDVVDPLVVELVRALLRAGADPGTTLYRDHLSLALIAHLDRAYGDRIWSPPPAGRLDSQRLRIVLQRLHEADETPTLAALGASVGLSAHHFARSFRNATGMPPHAYLRTLRIERAKRLLSTSSASITEISLDCGYATPSTFATAFLRLTGETPSGWRRRRRA